MITWLRQALIGSADNKRLLSNIFALGILQGANYLLPLLSVPYLVRVLGPEHFGLLAFATATTGYFALIADYGFNLSATRQISINRNDPNRINEVFSSVMTIKILLMAASFILLSTLIFSCDKFRQNWPVYMLSFGIVIGQVLFPAWLFQGLERMKYVTQLNVCSKIFFTLCIFIFVHDQTDYLLVPLFTALGLIVAGIFALHLSKRELQISFSRQPISSLKKQLMEGWHVFSSSLTISAYTISTTFLLGLFASNAVVGYFSAADKIIQAFKGLYSPIAQAAYPLVSMRIQQNKKEGLKFVRKISLLSGSAMFIVSTTLFTFTESLVPLILGEQSKESIPLVKIMAFLPFIISLSNIFGIQVMLNLGYKQAFSRILLVAAISGVTLSVLFIPTYQAKGAAIVVLLIETFVTCAMAAFLTKNERGRAPNQSPRI